MKKQGKPETAKKQNKSDTEQKEKKTERRSSGRRATASFDSGTKGLKLPPVGRQLHHNDVFSHNPDPADSRQEETVDTVEYLLVDSSDNASSFEQRGVSFSVSNPTSSNEDVPKATFSHFRSLKRPSKFEASSDAHCYRPLPSLKCALPCYTKLPLPVPWGLKSAFTARKEGHPTCPPAPLMENHLVLTYSSFKLRKYYNQYLCPDT